MPGTAAVVMMMKITSTTIARRRSGVMLMPSRYVFVIVVGKH